jgi:hypothetical protein
VFCLRLRVSGFEACLHGESSAEGDTVVVGVGGFGCIFSHELPLLLLLLLLLLLPRPLPFPLPPAFICDCVTDFFDEQSWKVIPPSKRRALPVCAWNTTKIVIFTEVQNGLCFLCLYLSLSSPSEIRAWDLSSFSPPSGGEKL